MPGFLDAQMQGWLILLVDDEPDSLEVAARWLTLAGASVLTANDGKLGLEVAMTQRPNLILADLSMPVMDGWEMRRALKNNPETACIPVIALTAHALPNIRAQVLAAGFAAHIAKPFEPRNFISEILQIVQSAEHDDQPETYSNESTS